MLVQNIAITYKCYSAIGNSLNLEEMMYNILRTFVSETYASYALYTNNINNKEEFFTSFGKIEEFDFQEYTNYTDPINSILEKERTLAIIRLEHGSIFLITEKTNIDCSFYISMFESFIHKLNLSIESCLNVEKMQEANLLLKQQKEKLKLANKAKDDFLANMSHELKTPLNSINVISGVMKRNKDNNLNEKQIKNLEIINNSGNELLFLVNDVLDLSKLEAGEISIKNNQIHIYDFINDIYEMILPQTKEKNINFLLHIDDTLDYIYSDENRIRQIIKNLLSNSIKFVKEGEINLIIKDEKETIKIIVKDDGIGIPKEKLANIFDRFKQVDESTTRKYGGTGLGLAICKELISLLKGSIQVKSTMGIGTSFELNIPKRTKTNNNLNKSTKEKIIMPDFKAEATIINDREDIIVYNNDPVLFFNIVIELDKKYKVEQENCLNKFLMSNKEKTMKKAVIDTSNLSKEELVFLLQDESNNFVFIYEKELHEDLKKKSLMNINKEYINKQINEI